MSVRAFTTHFDKYGVRHDIELVKPGYSGASTELRGSDGFLQFTHENLSESDVFSTPIQRGRLDYGVFIDSDGARTVIDEMLVSQEGNFIMKWYQNSVLFWTGTVALDLSNFEEASFPYRAQIVAKDLSFIEGILFPTYEDPTPANSFASRRTLISLVAECLPYGLNIVTATSWVESHINSAQDFMRQVYLDASTLAGLTLYQALERIMVSNGLFLKQTDGVWLIEQLSAHQTPSSVTRWTYNSSGVYQSEAVVNPVISANSQLKVVTGSLSSFAPAYKQVTVQYDSVLDEALKIPETVDPRSTAQSYSMQYISQYDIINPDSSKIDRVRLSGTVKEEIFFSTGSSATKITKTVKLQIYAGDQYLFVGENSWTSNGWTNAPYDYPVTLKFDSYDTTTRLATFIGEFNIESTPIPKPFTTTNYGRLVVAFLSSSIFQIYENVKFELVQGDIVNSVVLTQADQFSTAFEQNVQMGDGPRAYAKSALRFATGALSLDKTTDQWQRRGSTSYRSHSVNLAKEIMDFQRSYGRTLQVRSRGAFTPSQTLSYDLEQFYYIGGQFDGYEGDWTMTFVRNQFSQDVDTFAVTGVLRPASVGLGQLVSSVVNQNRNSIEATGQFVLRLLLGATGTVSQIFVFDQDEFVKVRAGQVLRLVHPVTLQSDEVTVASDRISGSNVNVVTKTLSADYPEGSWVYISAQSVQAGILVGENSVRIFAEGQSLGALTADVDGSVTQLDVNLYTKVIRGMEMAVLNEITGELYAVVVDQNTAGPGEVTLDIEEQIIEARAGSKLVGDNAFQQSQITVTQGLIVLKVNSNGKVAQIKLGADDLGSEIDISAEQVKINGIIFTEGTDPMYFPGDIATLDYMAGSAGWKIDGDGSAEFNDVTVRGTIEASLGEIAEWSIGSNALFFDRDSCTLSIDSAVSGRTLTGQSGSFDTAGLFLDADNYFLFVTQGDFATDARINFRGGGSTSYVLTDNDADRVIIVLPTSSTGLPSGAIWNNAGTITVV